MFQPKSQLQTPVQTTLKLACSVAMLVGATVISAQDDPPPFPAQPATAQDEQLLTRLYFVAEPWSKVLQHVAEATGSTLVAHDLPDGRYSRQDWRKYDRTDAVRILNNELEPLGFRILEKDQFLTVIEAQKTRPRFPRREFSPNTPNPPASETAATMPAPREEGTAAVPTVRDVTPIRQTAFADDPQGAQEETAQPEPTVTKSVATQNQAAADVAFRLYNAFGARARIVEGGPEARPGFVVYRSNTAPGNPLGDGPSTDSVLFSVEVDNGRNELVFAGSAKTIDAVASLAQRLDATPPEALANTRMIAGNASTTSIAEHLAPELQRLVAARQRSLPTALIAQTDPAGQPIDPNVQESAPAAPEEQTLPVGDGVPLSIPLTGLKGPVTIETIPELDLMILRGNEADVARVMQVIQAIEKLAEGAAPRIHIQFLQYTNSDALSALLNDVYTRLTTLRDREGEDNASVNVVAVSKPNAVMVLAPDSMMKEVIELIEQLDQPVDPRTEVEVFHLRHAVASQVVAMLQEFYATRTGLGTRVVTTADMRTNTVIVQAQPNDLTEIGMIIRQIDADASGKAIQMKVIKLNQAVADEMAEFLNTLLESLLNPPTLSAQAGGFGAGGQAAQELREPSAIVLEFVRSAPEAIPGAAQLLDSGLLEDDRLIRSGLLTDVRVNGDLRTNSLTVTAPAATMRVMEELIRVLDQPSATVAEVKAFSLKNADAASAVELLEELFAATDDEDQIGIQVAGAADASSSLVPLRFTFDSRTNTVFATGGADALEVVNGILFVLDESDFRDRETRVIRLQNSQADTIAERVNIFLEGQRELATIDPERVSTSELLQQEIIVTPEATTNSLIISATPTYFDIIENLVLELDREPEQVVIQALLVEVVLDDTDEFGVELGFQDPLLFQRTVIDNILTIDETTTAPNGTQTTTQRIITQTGTPGFNFNNQPLGNNLAAIPGSVGTQSLSNFALGRVNGDLGFGGLVLSASSDAVSVLIRALKAHRTVNVLSRPMVLALDNQLAQVQVGQQVPIVDGVTITNNIANPNVIYDEAGIILTVSPRISRDGQIVMEVAAEKSAYTGDGVPIFTDAANGTVISSPIKDITTALTTVKVPDGQTVVVGGMITENEVTDSRSVPWLGDIPLVGNAFRYDAHSMLRTELLIFLTPRIIRSDADYELIKEVEAGRMHFFHDHAEEVHGPIFGILAPEETPPEGTTTPGTPAPGMMPPASVPGRVPPSETPPGVIIPPQPGPEVPPMESRRNADPSVSTNGRTAPRRLLPKWLQRGPKLDPQSSLSAR